jgi:hypothetical protein
MSALAAIGLVALGIIVGVVGMWLMIVLAFTGHMR